MDLVSRASPKAVALETTLLVHGVPRDAANRLARRLHEIVTARGAEPCVVGLFHGRPVAGLDWNELVELLAASDVPKVNTANLGVLMHRARHGATTVSATMEIAAAAGVRVFATGGLGGVHRGFAQHLDISSDLTALARLPVAVVCSGVKSLLDVAATREALETLGVPVIGYRTEDFPAFYLRRLGDAGDFAPPRVDARFDDPADLARFVLAELARARRGIVICNPVPREHELAPSTFREWLTEAEHHARAKGARGRDVTPATLGALHEVSEGATLRTNLALVESNAALAAEIAAHLGRAG